MKKILMVAVAMLMSLIFIIGLPKAYAINISSQNWMESTLRNANTQLGTQFDLSAPPSGINFDNYATTPEAMRTPTEISAGIINNAIAAIVTRTGADLDISNEVAIHTSAVAVINELKTPQVVDGRPTTPALDDIATQNEKLARQLGLNVNEVQTEAFILGQVEDAL